MADYPAIDPMQFRKTLGHFVTGVTVVTVAHEEGPRGMTANAFMSVSLDPPLVLVSVAHRAHMHAFLGLGARYGVNILSDDQEAVSRHFSGRPNPDLTLHFSWHEGIPLLGGAIAHIAAEVVDVHPAGDHTLFIGRVLHLDVGTGRALLYYAGLYGHISSHDLHVVPEWMGF
jgi:flavin reductase (DIM6/NTAB) family NADH-FMN oxidoreductase RutF